MIVYDWHKKEYFKNPDSGVDMHWWSEMTPVILHRHNYYEIFIITKGRTNHLLNSNSRILEKYDMCLLRPNDIHSFTYKNIKVCEHINFSCTTDVFDKICSALDSSIAYKIEQFDDDLIVNLSDQDFQFLNYSIAQVNLSNYEDKAYLIKNIIANLICKFFSKLQSVNILPKWFDELLLKINSPDFIGCNANNVKSIAPYSSPIILEHFKKYLGCNITTYLTKIKINYACNLLENTDFSMLYIAGLIGYDSLSHFNRLFKKVVGITPGDYRKSKSLNK